MYTNCGSPHVRCIPHVGNACYMRTADKRGSDLLKRFTPFGTMYNKTNKTKRRANSLKEAKDIAQFDWPKTEVLERTQCILNLSLIHI